jgi:hypothetical protein
VEISHYHTKENLIRDDKTHLLELLAVEEIAQELLNAGDTGGTTNKDDLVNLALLHSRVLENLLDGLQSTAERLGVQVLETSTGDGRVEVLTIEERVNLNGGLSSVGQSTLSTLTSSSQTAESAGVARQILAGLALEFLLEVVKKVGVKVLTTKVSVTSSSLDGEDTTLDVQQRHIESTTTKIVDQDVALLVRLTRAETVSDGGSSGLVDDTEDVQASNGTGVLGSLTLVVVEVGRHSDDGLLNLLAKLGLGNFFHLLHSQWVTLWHTGGASLSYLHQDHGGDLLGRESLDLTQVVNLDEGVTTLVDDLEGPRLDILLDNGVIETATDQTPAAY